MTDLYVMKGPGAVLVPADDEAKDTISKWPTGQGIRVKVTRARNIKFHRKFFAMLNVAFDAWDPVVQEYKGDTAVKNLERFRKDVLILAGFYVTTVNLRGEVRLEAESISFANMGEDRFDLVYSKVAEVLLEKVLRAKGYDRAELDRVVEELLQFD